MGEGVVPGGKAETTRRVMLLLAQAALASGAQLPEAAKRPEDEEPNVRLPNGKRQIDEILKADREQKLFVICVSIPLLAAKFR